MSNMLRHFIFGYGSLICPKSRSITAPTIAGIPATPALIYHMERTWSARIDSAKHHLNGWTAMGVRFREGRKCSGVLIEVDEEELKQFDVREAGYDRHLIPLEHIHKIPDLDVEVDDEDHEVFRRSEVARRLSGQNSLEDDGDATDAPIAADEDAEETEGSLHESDAFIDTTLDVDTPNDVRVWVYVQSDPKPANKDYPIHQSYVDIILRGCLSISEDFAKSFLHTTHGWWHSGEDDERCYETEEGKECAEDADEDDDHHTWVEDRHLPMYVRADPDYSNEMRHKLDALVKEHHPEAIEKRRTFSVQDEASTAAEESEGNN